MSRPLVHLRQLVRFSVAYLSCPYIRQPVEYHPCWSLALQRSSNCLLRVYWDGIRDHPPRAGKINEALQWLVFCVYDYYAPTQELWRGHNLQLSGSPYTPAPQRSQYHLFVLIRPDPDLSNP